MGATPSGGTSPQPALRSTAARPAKPACNPRTLLTEVSGE
jgi:hypothetical protein